MEMKVTAMTGEKSVRQSTKKSVFYYRAMTNLSLDLEDELEKYGVTIAELKHSDEVYSSLLEVLDIVYDPLIKDKTTKENVRALLELYHLLIVLYVLYDAGYALYYYELGYDRVIGLKASAMDKSYMSVMRRYEQMYGEPYPEAEEPVDIDDVIDKIDNLVMLVGEMLNKSCKEGIEMLKQDALTSTAERIMKNMQIKSIIKLRDEKELIVFCTLLFHLSSAQIDIAERFRGASEGVRSALFEEEFKALRKTMKQEVYLGKGAEGASGIGAPLCITNKDRERVRRLFNLACMLITEKTGREDVPELVERAGYTGVTDDEIDAYYELFSEDAEEIEGVENYYGEEESSK